MGRTRVFFPALIDGREILAPFRPARNIWRATCCLPSANIRLAAEKAFRNTCRS